MLSRCGHSFLVTLVRFKCARNSRVDHVSCLWGWLDVVATEPDQGNMHVAVDA